VTSLCEHGFHGMCGSETLLLAATYKGETETAKTIGWISRSLVSRQEWPEREGDNSFPSNVKRTSMRFAYFSSGSSLSGVWAQAFGEF
jgi:hypothetical protein